MRPSRPDARRGRARVRERACRGGSGERDHDRSLPAARKVAKAAGDNPVQHDARARCAVHGSGDIPGPVSEVVGERRCGGGRAAVLDLGGVAERQPDTCRSASPVAAAPPAAIDRSDPDDPLAGFGLRFAPTPGAWITAVGLVGVPLHAVVTKLARATIPRKHVPP